jgi:hypothetical protein
LIIRVTFIEAKSGSSIRPVPAPGLVAHLDLARLAAQPHRQEHHHARPRCGQHQLAVVAFALAQVLLGGLDLQPGLAQLLGIDAHLGLEVGAGLLVGQRGLAELQVRLLAHHLAFVDGAFLAQFRQQPRGGVGHQRALLVAQLRLEARLDLVVRRLGHFQLVLAVVDLLAQLRGVEGDQRITLLHAGALVHQELHLQLVAQPGCTDGGAVHGLDGTRLREPDLEGLQGHLHRRGCLLPAARQQQRQQQEPQGRRAHQALFPR